MKKLLSQVPKTVKMREYRAKDPEKHRKYLRYYRKENPEKTRLWDYKSALKKRYGISLEAFNQMWITQEGKCSCCQQKMNRGGQKSNSACLDHNHSTGKVRAILCAGCNVAIAHLKEDPFRCELAAAYLRKHLGLQ